MALYSFHGYSADAFGFDEASGTFQLDPDYSASTDRTHFQVRDNDDKFEGDVRYAEDGDDRDQNGEVFDANGKLIAKGSIYVEEIIVLRSPDGVEVTVDRIEIDGVTVGFVPSEPLEPGVSYTHVETRDVGGDPDDPNSNIRSYEEYEQDSVACFGPGTMIETEEGDIPVEWLETGDRVLTRDNGYQKVVWIGRSRLSARGGRTANGMVQISAGGLGNGTPSHDLLLTGDHRVLLSGYEVELLFGEAEVLAPSKAWIAAGLAGTYRSRRDVSVFHFACAAHQVVRANGAWVESFLAAPEAIKRLDPASLRRLQAAGLDRMQDVRSARQCLTVKEAVGFLSRQQPRQRSG